MNAVSSYDSTKAQPVLNSLSLAFTNTETKETLQPQITPSEDSTDAKEGSALETLQAHFSTHITDVEARTNRFGTMMHIRMPVKKFQRALSSQSLSGQSPSGQGGFLQTLISLIEARETAAPYRMDIILNTPESPDIMLKNTPELLRKDLETAASFAQTLEQNGLPKKLMSTGLFKGDEGFIDLFFRRYEPLKITAQELAQTMGVVENEE